MAKRTAKQIAEKYGRRGEEALQDYLDGVDGVTESPMEKAILKLDKAKQNYIAAITSGKTERGLRRVSLPSWKQITIAKGTERYASGVRAAVPKVEAFMTELLPHIDAGKEAIAKMPDTTFAQNLARSAAFLTHMHKFKRA